MSVVALVLGMLAVSPVYAGNGTIKKTYSDTPYKVSAKPATPSLAKAQPAASQAKPKIQVAVMAKSPSQPVARRTYHICR
jgi:hypothetical protein